MQFFEALAYLECNGNQFILSFNCYFFLSKGDCDDDDECEVWKRINAVCNLLEMALFPLVKYLTISHILIWFGHFPTQQTNQFSFIQGGLVCFQRDANEDVPGCTGSGTSQWDYCYDRSKFPTQILVKENNLGTDSYGLCEGNLMHSEMIFEIFCLCLPI